MSIVFDENNRIFRLDAGDSSYAFLIEPNGYVAHLYYGGRLNTTDLRYLYRRTPRAFSPNPADGTAEDSRDVMPQEYSTSGIGDYRVPSAKVRRSDGYNATDMKYRSHRIYRGKPAIAGLPATFGKEEEVETLELLLADGDVEFTLFYTVFEHLPVIARSVKVSNRSGETVYIEKAASCTLDFAYGDFDLLHLPGAWARERHAERRKLNHSIQRIESGRGLSSHQHNPFFALVTPDATETAGEAYGVALLYSGNFSAEIELDQFDQVRTQIGINPDTFEWKLGPNEEFHTPEAVLVYSAEGLGGMSRAFHDLFRRHLIRSYWRDRKRPVLVNNWEATYFNFDAEKLIRIAEGAARLGIEMLVLDDGWFGHRDDDRSSLGDWFVFESKLKGGLAPLVKRVNELGLKFGLWFEPEMVSRDSELFRAHPEWVLSIPGRPCSEGRQQLVLDMSQPEVVDHLFRAICAILDSAPIEYIKWDANRHLTEVGSATLPADRKKELFHRYVLGMYRLHELLLERYPKLLIEGCSGGGGRFDAGMLYYVPQIWTSDDTDAIERLEIQYGTSLLYPSSAMGAHVSACPNHQTGRTTPFETRGIVAMAGTFGYELDLNKLDEAECDIVRRQIADYHRYNHIIAQGTLYRLSMAGATNPITAWEHVSADRSEALVSCVQPRNVPNGPLNHVRLRGLEPETLYELAGDGRCFLGDTLMKAGLPLPRVESDGCGWQFYLKAVK